MDKVAYAIVTLFESVLGVFGVRSVYDQPAYTVVARLDRGVEIRSYASRLAVETDARGQGDGAAFGRLFRYISGANRTGERIAMTAPVEATGRRIAKTVPVETVPVETVPVETVPVETAPVERGTGGTMRFFLPRAVAEAGAPEPTDAAVRLVEVPAEAIAVLRFSGTVTPEAVSTRERILADVLAAAGRETRGSPVFLGYDPPFAIPFLRRNEVAARLSGPPSPGPLGP